MDVQVFPTLSNFPSTPDIPSQESIESHPSDESWETESCETPTTSIINYDIEENTKRDEGTIGSFFDPSERYGYIFADVCPAGRRIPLLVFK